MCNCILRCMSFYFNNKVEAGNLHIRFSVASRKNNNEKLSVFRAFQPLKKKNQPPIVSLNSLITHDLVNGKMYRDAHGLKLKPASKNIYQPHNKC